MTTDAIRMLRSMKLIRAFETTLAAQKNHGFQLLSTGEEAVAVGLCAALTPDDQLLTGGRSIGPALARGVEPSTADGGAAGQANPAPIAARAAAATSARTRPPASSAPTRWWARQPDHRRAGVAMAHQLTGKPGIVVLLFGDGASGAGALHETMNIAALWRLPLLFVCNNNQMSVSTPRTEALAPKLLSDFAKPFGMPTETVDGMDLDVVVAAARKAAEHVRSGAGPAFIECVSYRFASHSTNARETRSAAELESIRARCPIIAYTAELKVRGLLDDAAEAALDQEAAEAAARAIGFANQSPYPEISEALTDVPIGDPRRSHRPEADVLSRGHRPRDA